MVQNSPPKQRIRFSSGFVYWLLLVGPASILGGIIAWINHVSLTLIIVIIIFLLGFSVSLGSVSNVKAEKSDPPTREAEQRGPHSGGLSNN
jgi:hypothetical protein